MSTSPQRAAPAFLVEPRLRLVEPAIRVVKRYANRKLYDVAASRYVKLEELADLVRSGVEVRVVEHASGRDVTTAALAHIIFDEEVRAAQRSAGDLAEVIRSEGRGGEGGAALAAGPDPALGRAEARSRGAVAEAARSGVCARLRLDAADGALDRLRAAAREVLDAFARARRDLSRIERRIDALHEQLRAIEC